MSAPTLGPVDIITRSSDIDPPRYSAAYLSGEPIPIGLPDTDEAKPGDVVRIERDGARVRVIISRAGAS